MDLEDSEPQAGVEAKQDQPPAAWTERLRPRAEHLVLAAITALAAVAYAWGIDHGDLSLFYAGAVRSMAHSWHNFFYGSFDPQGTISIDKLPGSLWVEALSVKVFGFHPWALELPDVVAGTLLIPVTYRVAKQVTGTRAALAAALIVAVTPAAVAEARGNEADPISVLLIVLAAGAVLRAVTGGRAAGRPGPARTHHLRPLIAAAVWLGLAFQVKMGEAWLPAPALAAGYLVAAPGTLHRRASRLAAAGAVLLAVSLSWMLVIAATPASDRPFIDGSADDSVFSQVFGYNGFGRFDDAGAFGLPRLAAPTPQALAYGRASQAMGESLLAQGSLPSWHRLLGGGIGHDAGWLLPAALVAGGVVLAAKRRAPRTDPQRAAVIVFGGWLLIEVAVFSTARALLPYYTAMLVPPIAILCVLGLKTLFGTTAQRPPWLVPAVILGAAAWTAWLSDAGGAWWPTLTVVLALAATAAFLVARIPRKAAPVLALAAVLTGPVAASYWMIHNNGSAWDVPFATSGTVGNISPRAASVFDSHPVYGGTLISNGDGRWGKYLADSKMLSQSLDTRGEYAVIFTSAAAADYVALGVDHVVPVGGYTGLVPEPDLARLSALLDAHQVAWAILPGPMDTRLADPRIQLFVNRCSTRIPVKEDDDAYYYVCQ